MATLETRSVKKSFGKIEVIHSVDLQVEDGEFVVFVGPSGCGKSTLLRLVAGLETVTAGQILIGGKRIDQLPPKDRGIAMVFQSYALYPHKSVRGNLGFALKHAGVDSAAIEQRVNAAAETLELQPLMDRLPRQLSGGQRQRVAIGRAIVREPEVFLFDEPLSNLDAALRVHMRVEILKLHQRLASTMIYVTHDQVEAMTLADRIVVFREGSIEQIGSPRTLYRNPANTFVAGFIGSPSMNFLNLTVADNQVTAAAIPLPFPNPSDDQTAPHTVGIRPEHLYLDDNGPFVGEVSVFEHLGGESFAHVVLPDQQMLIAKLTGESSFRPGDTCRLAANPANYHWFGQDGSALCQHRTTG